MRTSLPSALDRNRDCIRTFEGRDQTIGYRPEAWQRWLGRDPDLATIVEMYPTSITRSGLRRLSEEAREDAGRVRRLFIATMIWGFGSTPYGPYRTSNMLASDANQLSRSRISPIRSAHALVATTDIHGAYEGLRIDLCGPAYISKFLYAAGLGLSLEPAPLVLDSQIARYLTSMASDGSFDASAIVKTDANGFVHRFADGYVRYLSLMSAWASELNISAGALELYMFDSATGPVEHEIEELPNGSPINLEKFVGMWRGSCIQENFRRGQPYSMELYVDEVDLASRTFNGRVHWPDLQDTWTRCKGSLAANLLGWHEIDGNSRGSRKGTEYFILGGSYEAWLAADGHIRGRWYNPERSMAQDANFVLARG
jgi:hypothetical protein